MFALLAAAFVGGARSNASPPLIKEFEYNALMAIKNAGGMKWTPGVADQFVGISEDFFQRRLMMGIAPFVSNTEYTLLAPTVSLEKNWVFGLNDHEECRAPVEDQGACGSCWAFSAVGQFGERRCAADETPKRTFKRFSPQYLVSCDPTDLGCDGGWLNSSNQFLTRTGTVEWNCVDYFSANGEQGACPLVCDDGSVIDSTKLFKSKGSKNYGHDMTTIMTTIYNQGPVQVGFTVYLDFSYYSTGIYHHVYGYPRGGHAVDIVGWGEDPEKGTLYWVVRNSWGPNWGETIDGHPHNGNNGGYFRIFRGNNECNIENEVWGQLFDAF